MTMPAVVLIDEGRIALQYRPRPTLRADQVLIEVDMCGICGSDLHASQLPQVYRGDCILGHESTGRVAAVGDEVEDWAVDQRVAVNPNGNVDGTCEYCRSGRPNFCRQATLETALGLQADGALAPLMAAFPGHLRRIPDEMGTLEAAWVEPTATALRAVDLAGELAGRTVLVTGGGPIGQLACRLAHLGSPDQILLMEPAPQRVQFATASHAVPIAADAAEAVDVVFECSGSAAATSSALKLLAPGGILVVVGAGPDPGLDSATILLKEVTVRGSYIYNDEFDRAIDLLATRQIAVADLTTVVSPLADALDAFDALRAGDIMKAFIAPGS
ncbi:zinc-binding dehydrogenase [Mycobacterium sp. AZCC_0083]|uniref:zinc-dependent alcohol dehydrogenase n=1 Tax=Mycobacterium sp. AZCC_0083 TaxID=2735882 RepID=UPI00161532BE|nr:alcohol dehydrogenase catalytic domain-containing protein [Mycobacterium sp. AZCC_0083]MBB5164991.1 threonine dehydrogenase-like Zn-dependent dehydrogenase [Mycobacterium sp. AZCC_0083]